jgi:hypothetical protein
VLVVFSGLPRFFHFHFYLSTMIIKRSKAMECGGMKKGKKYGP